jgi:hypothetical protein
MAAVNHLFAGCVVADLAAARPFYERLFGREADLVPHAEEACWKLDDDKWIVVLQDPGRAGGAVHTALVDDLDGLIEEWAARGLVPDDVRDEGPGARKARIYDPDGNELGFAQVG